MITTKTTAKEQKIIAPLQALGSNDAKEIFDKFIANSPETCR